MYCRNCGAEIEADMAFCDACGNQLKIDGIQQPNALSDSAVFDPQGIQGEHAQQKYLILGWTVTAVVLIGLLLKLFRLY